MGKGFRTPVTAAFTSILLCLCAVVPGSAQSEKFFEISRHVIDIDAEFDDSLVLRSPSFIWNIPSLQEAEATGFAIGASGEGDQAVGTFRYLRANPVATSILGDTLAAYRSYDLDFYYAPFLRSARLGASPTFRIGTGYTTLKIPGSVTDGTEVKDGSFGSIGLHLGVGGIIRVANWVQFTADYSRRYLNFGSAKGFGRSIEIQDGLSATTDVVAIGVGVYLPNWRRSGSQQSKPSKPKKPGGPTKSR